MKSFWQSKPENRKYAEKKVSMEQNVQPMESTEQIMQNENILLDQIEEFRGKARQLQELLTSREQKLAHLQQEIELRQGRADYLDKLLAGQEEEANRLITGVTIQVQDMTDALEKEMDQFDFKVNRLITQVQEELTSQTMQSRQQLDEQVSQVQKSLNTQLADATLQVDRIQQKLERQMDEIAAQMTGKTTQMEELFSAHLRQNQESSEKQAEEIRTTLQTTTDALRDMKGDILERIHTEDVKCYRNTKAVLEHMKDDLDTSITGAVEHVQLGEKSMKALKKPGIVSAVFSILACAAAVGVLLVQLGLISL